MLCVCVCAWVFYVSVCLLLARTVKHTLNAVGFLELRRNSRWFFYIFHTLFVNKRPLCGLR